MIVAVVAELVVGPLDFAAPAAAALDLAFEPAAALDAVEFP